MIAFASLSAAVFVYLLVGSIVGIRPTLVDQTPRPTRRRSANFADWLNQAQAGVSPAQFLGVSFCVGALAGLVVLAATRVVPLGLLAAFGTASLPRIVYARRRALLASQRLAAWPDVLRDVTAHLRASQSVHASLCEVGRSGPLPLRPFFARYQSLSDAIDQRSALEVIREELADPLSDRIIEILLVAFDQGSGVVIEVLDDLATSTTADLRLLEEIETAQLETRLEARAASVLPLVVLGLLCATSVGYRSFYSTPLGWAVIVAGALLSTVGLFAISRLGRVPGEERILAGAT